jgi:integrase
VVGRGSRRRKPARQPPAAEDAPRRRRGQARQAGLLRAQERIQANGGPSAEGALATLKRHRKRQLEEKLGAGGSYEDSGLIFATAKGTPLDAQNVVNRHFKPLLGRADLPDIRWHDLRHSCFTLLLSRGVHPKFVQHLAGHASIQLTLDRYSHWMPTMGKHTASAMDEVLDEAGREDAPEDEKGALER